MHRLVFRVQRPPLETSSMYIYRQDLVNDATNMGITVHNVSAYNMLPS